MPEALAIVVVFVVAVIVYVSARIQSRDPARQNPAEDLARLRQHHAWLSDRLERARREGWGEEMTANFEAEVSATARQIEAKVN